MWLRRLRTRVSVGHFGGAGLMREGELAKEEGELVGGEGGQGAVGSLVD